MYFNLKAAGGEAGKLSCLRLPVLFEHANRAGRCVLKHLGFPR